MSQNLSARDLYNIIRARENVAISDFTPSLPDKVTLELYRILQTYGVTLNQISEIVDTLVTDEYKESFIVQGTQAQFVADIHSWGLNYTPDQIHDIAGITETTPGHTAIECAQTSTNTATDRYTHAQIEGSTANDGIYEIESLTVAQSGMPGNYMYTATVNITMVSPDLTIDGTITLLDSYWCPVVLEPTGLTNGEMFVVAGSASNDDTFEFDSEIEANGKIMIVCYPQNITTANDSAQSGTIYTASTSTDTIISHGMNSRFLQVETFRSIDGGTIQHVVNDADTITLFTSGFETLESGLVFIKKLGETENQNEQGGLPEPPRQ